MPARSVFRARRNAFIDRILRSAYAKGRARGLVSGGWWLLPGGQAAGHDFLVDRAATFGTFHQQAEVERDTLIRGHARRVLAVRSATIRFNRMFRHTCLGKYWEQQSVIGNKIANSAGWHLTTNSFHQYVRQI